MPSFEIPDGPTTVALKTEAGFHKGNAVFGVTNKTGEGLTARFSVQIQGGGKAEWYSIQGEPERPVAAGETQTVTVVAKIPAATPAGQHRIKLRATNVNDPDNDSTDSAVATVTIPAVVKPPVQKKPFPWWIIAVAAGVLVLVIGVIVAVVLMSGPKGTAVPKVTGLDYPAAVAELKKSGFAAAPAINEISKDQPLGLVFKQEPTADTKADPAKTEVKLTVAVGETVAVPTVTDKPYVGAQALLEDRGFTVGPRVVGEATGKEPDTVVAQDPTGETSAPKGSPVNLTVDPGVVVPDLVTPQFDGIAGIKTLQSAGLDIGTIGSACRGTVDKIIEQSVEAKSKVAKGTKVNIVLGAPSVFVNGRQTCRLFIRQDVLVFANRAKLAAPTTIPTQKLQVQ
ncbi:PASTA domain-containing protein [Caulobacter sp. UNC279MFTsu5.1]|uniref:PASTA domain-containing protein n=1 Tax=Caulobacter sp. UNC279MFTsu5.1 TaxID=1502775 RepID=UPI0003624993|nr:PASTA domain-containing protein [Caulobacter sp. UNC279MFTsu5.1]SFK35322.1 serine/threonine protein kinase [Caulobacter sp. UNC279MFTsu5.1]